MKCAHRSTVSLLIVLGWSAIATAQEKAVGVEPPPIRSLKDTASYRHLDPMTNYTSTSYIDREYYLKTNDVIYYYYQAQTAFSQRNFRKAVNMAEQSVNLEPTAEALGLLGSSHFYLGDKEMAILQWRKALVLDPTVTVPEYIKPLLPGTPEQHVDGPE